MAATVVTSENLAEFNAQRMGISSAPTPTEAVATTEPVAEKPSEETITDVEAKAEQEEHKPLNPKVEKRFSELTKQREDARREVVREREAREAAEAKVREFEAKAKPAEATKPDAKPSPAQFTDAFEYAEALAEWSVEDAFKTREKAEESKKQIAERDKVVKTWNDRQTATKATYSDYEETIAESTIQVSDQVRDAILESDMGPQILYHLAKNPEIADSLASKSVSSALREIGKLEAKLSSDKSEPAKPVQTPSKASPPISPIRATKSIDSPIGSDGEFHGTYAEFKAAYAAGKIK